MEEKVPQLRFPEFSNANENNHFSTHRFNEIFQFSTGKNIKQSEASPDFEIPCVRYGELYNLYDEVIRKIINKTNLDRDQLKFSQGDEILLPSAGEDPLDIGSASALTIKDIAIGRTINILRPKNESLYSQIFVSYYINQRLRRKIATLAKGVSISNVYNSDLKKLKIVLPSLTEQQKIADFLYFVDQKIQQLKRKKELLEEYKKGVMQKLFSQEIRFKDENGEDFREWEEKNVDKFLKLFVTNSFSRNDLTYESGEVRNIHYGDIHSGFKMGFKVNEETVPYIVKEKKLSKYDEEQYVKPGDLIVADASEDYVDIGKAIEVLETGDEKILSGLHTIHARDKKPLTVVGFKGYIFRSEAVRKQLKRVSQGASVLGISKGNFREISVKLPCLAEQRKIVEFLQNIDKKITLVESKIEKFQTFKKGLLQQMFV